MKSNQLALEANLLLASRDMRAIAAGLTDIGRERNHNEDRFILLPEFNVFVVADGMGGHQSGEVASRMAASTIANFFRTAPVNGADTGERGYI